jgi:predicted GNAT superfamily acetyltransferase
MTVPLISPNRARHRTYPLVANVEDTGRLDPIQVRRLVSHEDYHQCEELQARVWGPDDVVRVPALVMITAQANGGFAFGAFAGGQIVGFVLAFPGLTDAGRVKQCSILMAVDPGLQNSGVGSRLKLSQRDAALAQGIDLITWTFDPLASANAHLNLHKLGCVASRYFVDLYGTAVRGLNAGLPTDRLLAEWWIREPAVAGRLAGAPADPPEALPFVTEVALNAHGLPALRRVDLDRGEPALLVEIPESIRAVKLADMDLARRWRDGTREAFQHYFACGYRAAGFHRLPQNGRVRHCFLLEQVLPEQGA